MEDLQFSACLKLSAETLCRMDKNAIGELARLDRAVLEIEWLAERLHVSPPHHAATAIATAVTKSRPVQEIEAMLQEVFADLQPRPMSITEIEAAFPTIFRSLQ